MEIDPKLPTKLLGGIIKAEKSGTLRKMKGFGFYCRCCGYFLCNAFLTIETFF